jgi:uncharacterized protein (DUF849 family)
MAVMATVMGDHLRAELGGNIYHQKGKLVTNEQPVARVARIAVE